MADWQQVLTRMAVDAEGHFDNLKARLGARLGPQQPLQIVPYRTYGTPARLFVKGRVLRDKGVRSAREDDNLWDNLLNMYRRFGSAEVPYARVLARYRGQALELAANEEGYFEGWIATGETAQAAAGGAPA